MLRTEDEAKQCWCPEVRQENGYGNAANRSSLKGRQFNCIASECMMWDFSDIENPDGVQMGDCGKKR